MLVREMGMSRVVTQSWTHTSKPLLLAQTAGDVIVGDEDGPPARVFEPNLLAQLVERFGHC